MTTKTKTANLTWTGTKVEGDGWTDRTDGWVPAGVEGRVTAGELGGGGGAAGIGSLEEPTVSFRSTGPPVFSFASFCVEAANATGNKWRERETMGLAGPTRWRDRFASGASHRRRSDFAVGGSTTPGSVATAGSPSLGLSSPRTGGAERLWSERTLDGGCKVVTATSEGGHRNE
ncbi:hypothetical protein NL676_037716 [Syzygium grande]|nr:hypothetical protein NL676_037716 [Syzygium grande]